MRWLVLVVLAAVLATNGAAHTALRARMTFADGWSFPPADVAQLRLPNQSYLPCRNVNAPSHVAAVPDSYYGNICFRDLVFTGDGIMLWTFVSHSHHSATQSIDGVVAISTADLRLVWRSEVGSWWGWCVQSAFNDYGRMWVSSRGDGKHLVALCMGTVRQVDFTTGLTAWQSDDNVKLPDDGWALFDPRSGFLCVPELHDPSQKQVFCVAVGGDGAVAKVECQRSAQDQRLYLVYEDSVFLSNGVVAIVCPKSSISSVDLTSGRVIGRLAVNLSLHDQFVTTSSTDGRYFAFIHRPGVVGVWDIQRGVLLCDVAVTTTEWYRKTVFKLSTKFLLTTLRGAPDTLILVTHNETTTTAATYTAATNTTTALWSRPTVFSGRMQVVNGTLLMQTSHLNNLTLVNYSLLTGARRWSQRVPPVAGVADPGGAVFFGGLNNIVVAEYYIFVRCLFQVVFLSRADGAVYTRRPLLFVLTSQSDSNVRLGGGIAFPVWRCASQPCDGPTPLSTTYTMVHFVNVTRAEITLSIAQPVTLGDRWWTAGDIAVVAGGCFAALAVAGVLVALFMRRRHRRILRIEIDGDPRATEAVINARAASPLLFDFE
jgi:hypothetical protein